MVLDPIPQSLPVHFFGSRPQPPTSHRDEQVALALTFGSDAEGVGLEGNSHFVVAVCGNESSVERYA